MSLVTKRLERKGSDSVLLNHRHRLAETRLAGIWDIIQSKFPFHRSVN